MNVCVLYAQQWHKIIIHFTTTHLRFHDKINPVAEFIKHGKYIIYIIIIFYIRFFYSQTIKVRKA